MHQIRLLIIVIGVFLSGLAYAQGEIEVSEDGGSIHPGMVLVEPTNIVSTSVEGEYRLVPYRERRKRWGGTVSVGYSTYQPENYEPDFADAAFDEVYSSDDLPMIELGFSVKRNLPIGSIGGELGVGIYVNESDEPDLGESTLNLYLVKLGGVYYMDVLSEEPTIVPYVSGGAYTMIFKESLPGTSKNGNTQVAFYGGLGIQFQLDWIDRQAARVAYESSGIESSFFFVEARTFTSAAAKQDPDFGSTISFAAGIRSEF
ncbi:MAG: hypothetical protein KF799_02190 [Bdellovibrionales bacterium]|nr:hypothetical protein [Bdellovibrionales bacterium]